MYLLSHYKCLDIEIQFVYIRVTNNNIVTKNRYQFYYRVKEKVNGYPVFKSVSESLSGSIYTGHNAI